ncbi:hypothetical protein BDW02DRAFT_507998 [Decorospora gaudefroyi]|uniref:GIY-YIG domain-containing protein n=1 Tax=Decorospora gaudefroyi TaxID=184978 RepID=A0A6A5K718_9PLEO|nr:hypothetical protein BDW02DRAFT_507998 [Decorospora gaudefroyi]
MATVQVSNSPPSPSHFSSSPRRPIPSTMQGLPTNFSPAQHEANTILTHLLNQLQDPTQKHYPKYGDWVQRHPGLQDFCFRCIRPQVWTFLQGRWSLDALKYVSGDLRFEGRAIYLNGVLGLDKRLRIYIGQSINLRQRVAQHLNFRYRRDNPSLHYHALQYSIYNAIGTLAMLPGISVANASLPGMDAPALLLNVLEMWMCLVFRSLPEEMLAEWLPDEGKGTISSDRKEGREGVVGGLNIACPLDHGEKSRVWLDLSASEDPLIREYLGESRKSSGVDLVKEEKDSLALRRNEYVDKATGYRSGDKRDGDADVRVVQWVVLGALAAVVGFALLSSKGGPQPRGRWK